jgi:hypothetical protein
MYQPLETDVSGRNYQEEMRDMLRVMIPVYETIYGGADPVNKGPSLIKEMNDMLEFAGATVTGVDNRPQAIVDYLMHHYAGTPKPEWYETLTGGA